MSYFAYFGAIAAFALFVGLLEYRDRQRKHAAKKDGGTGKTFSVTPTSDFSSRVASRS